MFEKKEQKKMPFDESNLEELTDPKKFKYATRIYTKSLGELYGINSIGMIFDIESTELITAGDLTTIYNSVKSGETKLYRLKTTKDASD